MNKTLVARLLAPYMDREPAGLVCGVSITELSKPELIALVEFMADEQSKSAALQIHLEGLIVHEQV